MKSPAHPYPGLTSELVMEIFDVPITFHRSLVRVTGSVTAALMLSHAIAWTETLAPDVQGWFVKSQDEWFEDTGLSRWEQETARRILRRTGFVEERIAGTPAKLWFRVHKERIGQALHDLSLQSEHTSSETASLS